jgi:predicted dehydrogenase
MHNSLYSPIIQKAISLVKDGVIGDILEIEIHWLDRRDRLLNRQDHWCHSLPGGIFGEYGPHPVYIASAFLGSIRPIKAAAQKRSKYPWVIADELKVLIEADNGIGSLTISCNSPVTCLMLDVIGTKRCVRVNDFTQIMTSTRRRSDKISDRLLDRFDLIYPVLIATASGAIHRILGRKQQDAGHYSIIQKFAECMRYNIAPPATVEDGRETTKILEEIWKLI